MLPVYKDRQARSSRHRARQRRIAEVLQGHLPDDASEGPDPLDLLGSNDADPSHVFAEAVRIYSSTGGGEGWTPATPQGWGMDDDEEDEEDLDEEDESLGWNVEDIVDSLVSVRETANLAFTES